ncbi:MAG TPA: HypC/HybG/HupF family hydrogenase formation chaperone [Nitrospiria bacterium]
MNLMTGEIVEIYRDESLAMGKLRVGGALVCAVLDFVPEARVGDRVVVESGVAIARVRTAAGKEEGDVSGDTGKGD